MQELIEMYEIDESDQEYFLELEKQAIIDAVNKSEKIKYITIFESDNYQTPGEIYYNQTYSS